MNCSEERLCLVYHGTAVFNFSLWEAITMDTKSRVAKAMNKFGISLTDENLKLYLFDSERKEWFEIEKPCWL